MAIHERLERQVAESTGEAGEVDLARLSALVSEAYAEADRERRATARSLAMMIEELGEAHQRLIDAFEVVPEGIALFDADDRFVMWNSRYAEMYGASQDSIAVGKTFEEVLRAGAQRGQYAEAVGRVDEWVAERMARHRQDSNTHEQLLQGGRWVRVEERRTEEGGNVGVRIDITDLKKREESFRLLFESSPIPMWVVDLETRQFIAVNDAAVEHYGYDRTQFLSMTTYDLQPAEDRPGLQRFLKSGLPSDGTRKWRHQKADGSLIRVFIYARAMTYNGRPARIHAIIDITAQEELEQNLIAEKLRTEAAINNMSCGLLMFDRDSRMVLYNPKYLEIFGLSSEQIKPGCTFQELMRQRQLAGTFVGDVDAYCTSVLEGFETNTNTDRILELPGGRSIAISSSRMPDGGWVSTHDDITEQKRTEARIAKEQNENKRLFETSIDLILVTDSRGTFVRVSPSSAAIIGYEPDEMVGRSASEFIHADDLEMTRAEMRMARSGSDMRNFLTRYVHKDGRVMSLAWSGVWSAPEKQYYFTGRDVTESRLAEEQLRYLAHYDQLTSLPNRTTLQSDLTELVHRARGEGRPAAIVLFDLDGFKDVNDTLGHSAGDQLLQQVAKRMTEFLPDSARFYRLGGDEFVLTLPDCSDPGEIAQVVQFVLKRLRDSFDIGGHQVFIGASAGMTLATADANPEDLVRDADLALYDAKASGGNSYRLFVPAMRAKAMARRQLDVDLRRAFTNNEFVVYFQPQLRVSDGAVVGAEALLRWRHPERGLLAPGAFVEALAESPVALDTGRWILQTACDRAAQWQSLAPGGLRVGVNLFPVQFHGGTLVDDVQLTLRRSGLPPTALELEITENIALGHDDDAVAQLKELRRLGVHIAFDDFGTGFASLSNLVRYPLTRVKIDRSFMPKSGDELSAQDAAIVRSLIAMAHNLGLATIAEGVETSQQAEFLRAEKCEEAQGYLYAKPLPEHDFVEFVRSSGAITKEPLDTARGVCPSVRRTSLLAKRS